MPETFYEPTYCVYHLYWLFVEVTFICSFVLAWRLLLWFSRRSDDEQPLKTCACVSGCHMPAVLTPGWLFFACPIGLPALMRTRFFATRFLPHTTATRGLCCTTTAAFAATPRRATRGLRLQRAFAPFTVGFPRAFGAFSFTIRLPAYGRLAVCYCPGTYNARRPERQVPVAAATAAPPTPPVVSGATRFVLWLVTRFRNACTRVPLGGLRARLERLPRFAVRPAVSSPPCMPALPRA